MCESLQNAEGEAMRVGMTKMMKSCLLPIGLAALLVAVGCGDKKRPPPAASASAKKAAPAAAAAGDPLADAIADTSLADTFIYSPVGKRDPFKSSYRDDSTGKGQDITGPQGPLQRYEIDQLKLVAVISGISQPRAMVTTPDGKGFTVKNGTRIGKNFGRVVRIKTSEVIIAEDYRDWNGRKVTNYIHMTLKKDENKR
jgi:type IV pilus assembly protein PilP